ncbi:unnamed protein product, partial [marine sediment metagenome]
VAALRSAITAHQDGDEVARLARQLGARLAVAYEVSQAPVITPDPARGAPLYAQNCSVCHGDSGAGDGPAGVGLEPAPANLRDGARLDHLSLYAIYNTLGMGDRALEHIRRHPDIWVLSFRFVYGLRTVMPVAIGLSGYPPGRYLLLNGIGAAIWATALAAAAYHFGAVLEGMLGSIKKYELWVLGALLVLGLCLWLRRRIKNARLARKVLEAERLEQARTHEPTTPAE